MLMGRSAGHYTGGTLVTERLPEAPEGRLINDVSGDRRGVLGDRSGRALFGRAACRVTLRDGPSRPLTRPPDDRRSMAHCHITEELLRSPGPAPFAISPSAPVLPFGPMVELSEVETVGGECRVPRGSIPPVSSAAVPVPGPGGERWPSR